MAGVQGACLGVASYVAWGSRVAAERNQVEAVHGVGVAYREETEGKEDVALSGVAVAWEGGVAVCPTHPASGGGGSQRPVLAD